MLKTELEQECGRLIVKNSLLQSEIDRLKEHLADALHEANKSSKAYRKAINLANTLAGKYIKIKPVSTI